MRRRNGRAARHRHEDRLHQLARREPADAMRVRDFDDRIVAVGVVVPGLFALLAATAFAVGSALQQRGALRTTATGEGTRFLAQLWRQPGWLLGALLQAVGWVLQAWALHEGSFVAVQMLTMLSLVIALPFGAWLTNQPISGTVVMGAVAVVGGIVVFLSVGSPTSGATTPSARDWWVAGLSCLIVIAVLAAAGRGRESARRAVFFGCAAGVAFGLQAAITKVFTDIIGEGLSVILRSWQTYALIASALVGFALQQSALKTGALAAALAASNSMTLLSSVALGLTVFSESLESGAVNTAVVLAGLGLIVAGVVALARAPAATARIESPATD
jgi:hypothetical protein